MNGEIEVSGILDTDPDMILIRKPFSKVSTIWLLQILIKLMNDFVVEIQIKI